MERNYIGMWLYKPLPALNGEKPIDVLALGEYRRVSRVIAALEPPVAS